MAIKVVNRARRHRRAEYKSECKRSPHLGAAVELDEARALGRDLS